MAMLITNLTSQDYWFGPLHLPAGNGQTLTVDDTSATSLYLTDDTVADAINTLAASSPAKITVTGAASPFPRATGVPTVLHGDGSPEGVVYAGQGSVYLRRDNTGGAQMYQKTTGIHVNTGWVAMAGAAITTPTGAMHAYGGTTAPTGWLICDGAAVSRSTYADLYNAIGVAFGAGDGLTTFNVPDMRGRVPVGYAASGGNADVSTIGLNELVALANRTPKHNSTNNLTLPNHGHSITDPGHAHSHSLTLPNHGHSITDPGHTHTTTTVSSAGGSAILFGGAANRVNDPTGSSTTGITVGNPTSNPAISGSITSNTTGITVGNPTSNPAIAGSIGPGGTTPIDTPAYAVVNYIIKT